MPVPLSGRVGHLSQQQQAALDTFRQQLKAEGYFVPLRHDDPYLLRFLRARKFDIPKAKIMIIDQEKWRKDFSVDELKAFDFPERAEVIKYYPQYYHKTDKDGRPVYIERLGKIDMKALYAVTTQERLLKRLVYEYERCRTERFPACTIEAKSDVPIETSCTILDLRDVGISSMFGEVKDYVSKASRIGQDRYPESMGKFFIINAPWGFATVWRMIKGWLDEVTVAKIDILGSSYHKELTAQIPPENLPTDFGGTCSCDGGCSLSDEGPWNNPEIMKRVEELHEERRKRVEAEEKGPTSTTTAPEPSPAAAPLQAAPANLPPEGNGLAPVPS